MQRVDFARPHLYNERYELMNVGRMGEINPEDDNTADMIGQNMEDKLSPNDTLLPADSNDNTYSSQANFINLMHSIDAKVDSEMREDNFESSAEKSSKSSRRKQSKPIRVQHVDVPNLEPEQTEAPQAMETTDGVVKDDQPNNTRNNDCNTPEFMDTEQMISCDFCSGTFSSLNALKEHLINTHANPINSRVSPSAYPTEYHRLASELFPMNGTNEKGETFENGVGDSTVGEKDLRRDIPDGERQSTPDGSIPRDMPDSNDQGDGELKSNGTRIFHPDAYCELCDREFCNKYFLKTHKANKHGIYDNTNSQAPPPPLGQVPPMPSPMFPMFLPQPPPPMPQPPQTQPENLVNMSHVTSATTSIPSPIVTSLPSSLPPMPMMMPALQPPEPSKKSPPLQDAPKLKAEVPTSTSSSTGGPDMEDYCEICQKHFCNKYYLRKHKLDVHGIQTEPLSSGKRSRSHNSHDALPFAGMGGLTSPMFLPQNIPNSMTNIMLINPFGPLMALPQNPSLFHAQLPQLPQTSTPLKMPPVMPSMPGLDDREKDRERNRDRERDREKERERDREPDRERDRERDIERERNREREREHLEREHAREREHDQDRDRDREMVEREREREREIDRDRELGRESDLEKGRDIMCGSPNSSSGPLSQEALRSMGVLNADAYCELCRKEFCNKYFLKIHKANKHGMYLDDSPMKRSPTGSTSSPFEGPLHGERDGEKNKRDSSGTPTNGSSRIGTPGTPSDMNMPLNFSTFGEPRHDDRSRQQMEQQIRQHVDQQIRQQEAERAMRHQADQHARQQAEHQRREQVERERGMRQQADQQMRQQVVDQIRQHADREREMRQQVEQQMQRQYDTQTKPPLEAEVCEICSKEFINKYTLQIHRLNAHGISSRDSETASTPTSDLEKSTSLLPQPLPADHPSSLPPASSSSSDIPTMPTMFSSMIAAKLADRVLCDICNKEVCNKYFLKTHKLKMHGIPPAPGSSSGKSQDREKSNRTPSIPEGKISPTSPNSRLNLSLVKPEKLNGSPAPMSKAEALKNSDKPLRHDELLKMGIDPEAYCELCKKEFCSKYFLRTHKLNMHGIRSDRQDTPVKKEEFPFKDYNKERERLFFPFLGSDFPYGGYGHLPPSLPLPPPTTNASLMEEGSQDSTGTVNSSNADSKSALFDPIQSSPLNLKSDKNKVREPANMIRVKCEICNKELCNKYFLRTHKLNKHGILDESLGLNMNSSFKLTDLQKSMLMAEHPLYFNGKSSYMDKVKQESMDGLFDGQMKLNAYENQRVMDTSNSNSRMDPSQFRNQSPVNDNHSDSSDGGHHFRQYTEVCHICQRRFKSLKWLKTHLVIEHNIKEDYIHDMLRENSRVKDSIFQTCSLCGMLFPDKVGLQIHMLQEHNAEVTLPEKDIHNRVPKVEQNDISAHGDLASNVNNISLNLKRKYSRNAKQKLHSCSQCDYKTRWLSNIYTHEERRHNIHKPRQYRFSCGKCPRVFRYEHSLYRHSQEFHKQTELEAKPVVNGRLSSKFRCAHCKTRFATRKLCRLHIRKVHGQEMRHAERKFRCSQCEYKTNFVNNYRNHLKQKHAKMVLEPLLNGPCNGEMVAETDEGKKRPVAYATPCDLTSQSSFIMQPFKLMDDNSKGQFVTAVVYLPVYQKINEPLTVSFQLSPTEQ